MNGGVPAFAYDEVAYPGLAQTRTRPDTLAAIATLHGLRPSPVQSCRVLELGCGDGRNLVPLAYSLPGAFFHGVDLSGPAVGRATSLAADVGLANVQFVPADLLGWAPPPEPFDFIIAHGLYSWVPEPVRDRLLAVCGRCLAPNGVAFVSYNTLPGGHLRRMLREILLRHLEGVTAPAERIAAARQLLEVLAAVPPGAEGHAEPLRAEARWMLKRDADFVLFHDDLAPVNEPIYFSQFVDHLARHELRFLAEADYAESQAATLPADVRAALANLEGDAARREQYRDYVRCRRFRQSLVCRSDAPATADPQPDRLRELSVAANCRPDSANVDLSPGVAERFASPRGPSVRLDHPLAKAALMELGQAWPRFVRFDHLAREAGTSGRQKDVADLTGVMTRLFASGLCELSADPPQWSLTATKRPAASPVARAQLRAGDPSVANLRHENVRIDDPMLRHLVERLDGTRSRADLANELNAWARTRRLKVLAGLSRANLQAEVDRILERMTADALLVR